MRVTQNNPLSGQDHRVNIDLGMIDLLLNEKFNLLAGTENTNNVRRNIRQILRPSSNPQLQSAISIFQYPTRSPERIRPEDSRSPHMRTNLAGNIRMVFPRLSWSQNPFRDRAGPLDA